VGFGLVLCLALAAASFAAAPPAAPPRHAQGRLVAVDAKAMTLEVKVGGRTEKFALAQTSQILANGQSVAVSTLHPGETVRVEYSLANGHETASKVELVADHAASSKPGR
jgi:hypothetical protein